MSTEQEAPGVIPENGLELVATLRQPLQMPAFLELMECVEKAYGKDCEVSGRDDSVLVWRKKNGPAG